MGKVVANASTSLDGYIAKQDNSIGFLFDWFQKGDVEVPTPRGDWALRLAPQSASYRREWTAQLGAFVCGRTLFDLTDGWDGRVDLDVPVIVVTHQIPTDWVNDHPDAPFSFITDGVEAAIRRAHMVARGRTVAVAAGSIAGQCLQLGLLDEVAFDLVPVVMGGGRPFFDQLTPQDVPLGDPTTCIQGDGVIHLVFPVIR
jgi:dihydrofolate reductase